MRKRIVVLSKVLFAMVFALIPSLHGEANAVGRGALNGVLSVNSFKYLSLALFIATAHGQSAGKFELLANYRDLGGVVATTVAPGPRPDTERFYVSYLYDENTLDVVAIDPDTGAAQVFHNPAPGEFGARNIAIGSDGNVYLGTLAHAHFLKVNRKQGKLIDLGRPSESEEYIWDVAFGSDKKLYGATYPGCKLVSYDPATGYLEDLGSLDPSEQYGRWIAADNDGFIYVGIGTSKANVAVYEIRTAKHREILPADARVVGIAKVYRGQDGKIYAAVGKRVFELNKWTAVELPQGEMPPPLPHNVLRDGRTVALSRGSETIVVTNPRTNTTVEHKVSYEGNDLRLFRLGFGPDGTLYGSAMLPIHFVKIDPNRHQITRVAELGGGEVYSFLNYDNRLLIGTYSGLSPLMSYDPGLPLHPAVGTGNPLFIDFKGSDSAWRPQAMIQGPDAKVYIGAVAGYGQLEGPLVEWDPNGNSVQQISGIVRDQSIVSLTAWRSFIIGGTTINGGGGSHPTQKEAKLFVWNTTNRKLEFDIVPVPEAKNITDLIAAPNGKIYGIADGTMFVFDPGIRQITKTQKLSFSVANSNSIAIGKGALYNCIGIGKDGNLWGLAEEGIFTIDLKTDTPSLVTQSPKKITGGFDIKDGAIYFVSDSEAYRYTM
jgi:streptogramin lyase